MSKQTRLGNIVHVKRNDKSQKNFYGMGSKIKSGKFTVRLTVRTLQEKPGQTRTD